MKNRVMTYLNLHISLAALCIATLTACEPQAAAQKNAGSTAMPVKVVTATTKKVTEWDEFTGRFEASKRVEVKARVGGFIEAVTFEDGQRVEKGQVLYELDKRPFQIELASAEANLSLAEKDLYRARDLVKKKSISEEQLDERIQQVQVAQANVDRAKLNLEFASVVAPISGRIDRTYRDEGNLINGGSAAADTLTTIVTVDPIYFYFSGSESTVLEYVRRGIAGEKRTESGGMHSFPVSVRLQDESHFLHEGTLDFSANTLDFDTGTTEARAVFSNTDRLIKPGMFGRLRLAPVPETDMITLDDRLIMSERNKKYVFVVGESNKAEKRYVTLGGLSEDGSRIIRSGLHANEQVVAGNIQMIRPGMVLQPVPAGAGE
ncbi:efflux RND transporter periplasmic adaptor subunit [Alteromonas sp. a30]|uniref:efflux RND transporter periplasmic adaptor subunit n=1 Tax=Alteromonas sp. a30 TaxID=2730917 RepID=UPI00227FAD89|nr:efflux RND transporter periplasmic adaptor subunit [Alteromonas sp. a30]MCY7295624.1 efflux RND transporter periplasmic adaptor subunit [Alteromonas sp. a30]